jgi:hypothetical protein
VCESTTALEAQWSHHEKTLNAVAQGLPGAARRGPESELPLEAVGRSKSSNRGLLSPLPSILTICEALLSAVAA